ncbi:MAG: DUF4185 domain-containing protein [Polyangiales bacterium]
MLSRIVGPSVALSLLVSSCRPSDFDHPGRWREDAAMEATPDAAVPVPEAGAPSSDGGCAEAPRGGRPLVVRSGPVAIARLTNPSGVVTRLPGPSFLVDGRRVWTFTTTRPVAPLSVDVPGNLPSSALTADDRPWIRPLPPHGTEAPAWALGEILAPGGTPRPFLRLRAGEGPGVNLAVTSQVAAGGDDAQALLYVQANVGLGEPNAVWLARLDAPGDEAVRDASPLFVPPDPMFALGALRTAEHVKVYACTRTAGTFGAHCVIARAPVDRIADRAAYQVYGRDAAGALTWLSDLTRGEPVLEDVSEDFSVSWNAHLGRFLSVWSAPLESALRLSTAPAMEGPWSEPVELPLPASRVYVPLRAREHPGLAQDCERRIVIAYWSPTAAPDAGSLPNEGDVVLAAIELE